MTIFEDGYIRGESTPGDCVGDLLCSNYDVLIMAPSWDLRCLCLTNATNISIENALIVELPQRDEGGLQEEHFRALMKFAESRCNSVSVLHSESVNITSIWGQLKAELLELRRAYARPLSILIDISTTPRYLSLAALAFALRPSFARQVTCLYVEGTYPPEPRNPIERHEIFTSGSWNAIPVDGLQGLWRPSHPDFYVVSVGFEGAKTIRTVSRGDPDRVAILFPDPGLSDDYVKRTRRSNKSLFDHYSIRKSDFLCARAGDAIAAWRVLATSQIDRRAENVSYVCCGTKPHAIGLALRAMCLGHPTVLYNLPDAHIVVPTEPNGVFWKYVMFNTTCVG